MKQGTLKWCLALAVVALPLAAQEQTRRASIRGGGGDGGKCTIEVEVDGVAEVAISGDTGRLRTLSGSPANWRRFECTGPMPGNPGDFRFSGVDGRGRQNLVRDPREGRGTAVIRIEDSPGGREGYTFDIEWRGGSGGGYPGGGGGYPGGGGGFPESRAISICQDAVRQRADRELGARNINFLNAGYDSNRGRNDWVSGTFETRNGPRERYQFSCAIDGGNGRVRDVELSRMGGGGGGGFPSGDMIRVCQDAVISRVQGDGLRDVNFRSTNVDNRPGRNDFIIGRATARDRRGNVDFDFSCSVDSGAGRIRSVDVVRR